MSTVDHAGVSDQGRVRFKNEDCIGHRHPDDAAVRARKGSLFVIADGVGGHGAGDVASSEAVEALVSGYYASHKGPEKALRSALAQANTRVFSVGIETNRSAMQTTLSAIAIVGGQSHIVHVGDTRIYRIRSGNEWELLTQDHSEVAELVKMNILSPDKVRNHPRRSIITRSLGGQPVIFPMTRTDIVREGDIFVLCTDGIWEPVNDVEIARIASENTPQETCRKLVALGLERQSTDNLSVQVIKVIDPEHDNVAEAANSVPWWKRVGEFVKRGSKTKGISDSSVCS